MERLRFKSIRSRLTFWFLLLTLIPLIVVLIITYFQQSVLIEARTFDKLTTIRELKVQQLNQWLDEKMGNANVIVSDFEIRGLEDVFEKRYRASEDLKKIKIASSLIKRYMKLYDDYEEIFIVGANTGLIEVSTNSDFVGENKIRDKYFTVPIKTGEIYIKDIYYSKTLDKPQMTISLPIYSLSNAKHIVGILVARINLDRTLYRLIHNRIRLGKTGETLLVNKEVLALNKLRWYDNSKLNFRIQAEHAVNAAHGKTGIVITTDYRGKKVLAAYTYIPLTGWGFICKQDLYELNAPIRNMVKNFIMIFIFTVVIIYFVTIIISKALAKPIVDLNSVAQKIKEGDFSVRNRVLSKDELGSLALAFNNMTDAIESRIKIQGSVVDISEIMIKHSTLEGFSFELLKQVMDISGASMSTFYILNEVTWEYEHFASIGANKELLKPFSAKSLEGEFGNAISEKNIVYLRDVPEDTIFKYRTTAGDIVPREIITIPILIGNRVVALISFVTISKFTDEFSDVLKQSWQAINVSYSNLLANDKTRILSESLTKTNMELESKSEEVQMQSEELQQTLEELQNQNFELDNQRKQVENANRLKSEFLSNMSHELRTPLNSIMALSHVLIIQAEEKLTEEENGYLKVVERNGKHLLSLINNILDLSKIESGKMDICLELISIDLELSNIKENLQPLAEKSGVLLSLSLPDNSVKVETDRIRFHQALSNIIQNAVKFTKEGSVDISVMYDAENVSIKVRDTGIGIPEDFLKKIFEEFRQVDGSSSRNYEGTGLGLAIANRMIKVLGGYIDVESKLGSGSTFSIVLPIKWKGEVDIASLQPHANQISGKLVEDVLKITEEQGGKNNKLPKILIIEDNIDNMITVKALLKNRYNVLEAFSGESGLDLSIKKNPDLVLLDMSLPGMDGTEVVKILKNRKETQNIPVIAMTARVMNEEKELFVKVGCDDFIAKPIDYKTLLDKLNKWLRK